MGRPEIDITGLTFDNLLVMEKSEQRTTKGQVLWELRCTCGTTCNATASDLLRGRRNFCPTCNEKFSQLSPYKTLYGNYRRNAEARGYTFNISFEDFVKIITQDCFYCGEQPSQVLKKDGARFGIVYNGIDRYNNTVGYTKDNVRPCCKFCNLAKSTFEPEDLTAWLDRVALRRKV